MQRNPAYTQIDVVKACRVLGLDYYTLTQEDLTRVHRELSARYHPDQNKDADATAMMSKINNAKDILQQVLDFRNSKPVDTSFNDSFNSTLQEVEALIKQKKAKDAIKLIKNAKIITNSFELAHVLDFFSDGDHRYTLVKHFKALITTLDELASVANALSDDKRFAFIKGRIELLDNGDIKKISQLFAILAEKQQTDLAKLILKRQPVNLAIFNVALKCIKPAERLPLALRQLPNYRTCRDVLDIAEKLTIDEQKKQFLSRVDYKKLEYNIMRDTIELLYLQPKDEQLSFLQEHLSSIQSGDDLQQALAQLKLLNPDEAPRKMLPYIFQFLQYITSWEILANILASVDDLKNREIILKTCAEKPFFKEAKQHFSHVTEVFKKLSPATCHHYLLNNKLQLDWLDYLAFLAFIPESERYDFATDFIAVNKPSEAIIQRFAECVGSARQQELLSTFIIVKPASDVSVLAPHSLFAPPPVTPPSVQQSLKFHLLFELNHYLSYSFKLHRDRVLELHDAILKAPTDIDIKKLIQQQSSLLLTGQNHPTWEHDASFFFLNRAPGKAGISIGYKRMLEKCMQHVATIQTAQAAVSLTRSFADVD